MTAFLFGSLSIYYDDLAANNNESNGNRGSSPNGPNPGHGWLALTILPRGLHQGSGRML